MTSRRKSSGKSSTPITDVVEALKSVKKASDVQVASLLYQMDKDDVDKLADLLAKLSTNVEDEPKSEKKTKEGVVSPSEKKGASFAQWFVLCFTFFVSCNNNTTKRINELLQSSTDNMIRSAREIIDSEIKINVLETGTIEEIQARISDLQKASKLYNFSSMKVLLMVVEQFKIWRDRFNATFDGDDEQKKIQIEATCKDFTGYSVSTMNKRIGLIEFMKTYPRFLYCDVSLNELAANKVRIEKHFVDHPDMATQFKVGFFSLL